MLGHALLRRFGRWIAMATMLFSWVLGIDRDGWLLGHSVGMLLACQGVVRKSVRLQVLRHFRGLVASLRLLFVSFGAVMPVTDWKSVSRWLRMRLLIGSSLMLLVHRRVAVLLVL